MAHPIRVAAALAILAAVAIVAAVIHYAGGAAAPSDMLVGTWKARNDATAPMPDDSAFEFSKDGAGEVSKTGKGKRKISWKIVRTLGNACIITMDYADAPKDGKSLKLLIAFDGNDSFVVQAKNSGINSFDRQK